MIYTLVLIVMALQTTQEKFLMESMILTRHLNRGIVSENTAMVRFVYSLSSSMKPLAVSGIYVVIRLKI